MLGQRKAESSPAAGDPSLWVHHGVALAEASSHSLSPSLHSATPLPTPNPSSTFMEQKSRT